LFSGAAPKTSEDISDKLRQEVDYTGPTRTLAKRGNEVFTVVDNQIRWSSLTRLKDEWQQQTKSRNGSSDQENKSRKQEDAGRSVNYRVRDSAL
jgi:nucleoporin NUP82